MNQTLNFSGEWTLVLTVGSTTFTHKYHLVQSGDVITGTGKVTPGNKDENVVGQVLRLAQGGRPIIILKIIYPSEGYGGCAIGTPTSNTSITGQYTDVQGTMGSIEMTKAA